MAQEDGREGNGSGGDGGGKAGGTRRKGRGVFLAAAVALTLAGAGMWVYAAATRESTPASAGGGSAARSGLASGFVGEESVSGAVEEGGRRAERLIDEASPAVARFGASALAGFALGYTLRRFMKVGLVLTGLALIGAYAAYRAGLIGTVDAGRIEAGAERAAEWAQREAGEARRFVMGLVPSGFAAGVGAFFGFRR